MQKIILAFLSIVMFFIVTININAQGRMYDGPDDPAGDKAAERTGYMTGNRTLVFFRNTSELSDCCGLGYDVSKWPNNFDGTKMHDGIATLVGARVFLENDTIPVTSGYEGRTDLDTLYYIQSSYREHMDEDPSLTIEYGLYPVFGYFNELSETPAMSNLPDSWPTEGWPTRDGKKWQGEWNGRFGRGIMKADLETFFVTNDAQDQEYLEDGKTVKYYPRPNVKIGDKNPNVSIQKGKPWGGIGVRIETRGFQWSNPSANDAIFWEHNIANISDYDLPEMAFGFWMDNAVGGEEGVGDDLAYYDKSLNMAYSWDIDFIPVGGGKAPGILGFAYLESPGLPYDNLDNDKDGLLNEKRDNVAVNKIGPTDGIENLSDFMKYYKLNESDLKEHWDADEDQDWIDGNDENGNGVYDNNEDAGNDVGLDGVGPNDINYTGPDADGTECNHKPDFIEGVGAEPNFAVTDVSESDMLGLTSFHYTSDIERQAIIRTDESLFKYMVDGQFHEFQSEPLNFMEFFASGIFPLYKGRTERVSMAELHSYDPLSGLMSDDHSAPALFRLKEVVQVIYETDYRFAQPPLMPTLTATPADGKIILTWDDVADQLTRDEFASNKNDFEGYKLYRATDKKMSDTELITDGFGNPSLRKPIFQCDKIDSIKGFADFGEVNGVEYYLGDDTGIKHYYIDEDVDNGRTYYYVLVAYDYGLPDVGDGISPSENNFVLRLDESEDVIEVSKNVAIVKPHQFAAGYVAPNISVNEDISTLGSSKVQPTIIVDNSIKPNHTYKVYFDVDTVTYLRLTEKVRHPADALYLNSGFRIYDVTENNKLVYSEDVKNYSGENIQFDSYTNPGGTKYQFSRINNKLLTSGMFDGLQIQIQNAMYLSEINSEKTGWVNGDSPLVIKINTKESIYFPWQYQIVFTGKSDEYTTLTNSPKKINNSENMPIGPSEILFGQSFDFYVINKSLPSESGEFERLDLLVHDKNKNGQLDMDSDEILVGYTVLSGSTYYWAGTIFTIDFSEAFANNNLPIVDNVYQIDFLRPFTSNDYVEFTVLPQNELDKNNLKEKMKEIKVVPNPYIMTNSLEPALTNYQLNQKRQLMFTNIPAQCVIKIFTVSGYLVDEIIVDNSVSSQSNEWDTNSSSNGTAFWDLKTREGLDIASGYYIYQVKSTLTGNTFAGKFAVVK
ncbi:MAG: hypothetical protein KKF62_06140 [Bacteroidetes bacterium]|nr:hypothetical protein [Bacteroidota bacterium]MBU1113588.1 hypothetical protein [Bacteroidota bacterium]MBU1796964.1 hypothetical protein [Bacteroidota bacterium]